jgi:tetratricopeptide (TPR) repeat protein
LLFLFGCSQNKYEIAKGLQKSGKYALAIRFYDQFINQERRGSEITIAEIERSNCYFLLGKKAYKNNDWVLANRLFYLSNSEAADSFMDNCYFELAKEAIEVNQIDTAFEHFDFILKYLTTSELIPEILFTRLNIYLNQGKKLLAYEDFNSLVESYPEHDLAVAAQPLIDKNMDYYIDDALQLSISGYPSIAIEKFLHLEKNPSVHTRKIRNEIANVYMDLAEAEIKNMNYIRAKRFFENTLEWDRNKQNAVSAKLNAIVNLFIDKGDELIQMDRIDEAIANYQEIFDIVPEHPLAIQKITEAETIKANYELAAQLIEEAFQLEKTKKFPEALRKYEQSVRLRRLSDTQQLIKRVKNLIEAEKDPIGFARSIIISYQDGLIPAKLEEIERGLEETSKGQVRSTGWRVLYAFGEYKYEIRYDITSPGKNYYFVWRVDLENGNILPLNKDSEEILSIQ